MIKIETLNYSDNFKDSRILQLFTQTNNVKPKTTIAFLPGTNFQNGSRADYKTIAETFCNAGLNVAIISYRLAPTWHMPAPIEDLRLAIQYLKSVLAIKGENPNQILLAGQLSSAYLALLSTTIKQGDYLGRTDELKDENTQVKGVILFSPIVSVEKNFHNDEDIDRSIDIFLGFDKSKESEIFLRDISPIYKSKTCRSSVLLFIPKIKQNKESISDKSIEPLIKFYDEYRSCKVPIKLIETEQTPNITNLNSKVEFSNETVRAMLNFIQEYIV